MLGSKINNLIKLRENGVNIPDFEIVKYQDYIDGNIDLKQNIKLSNKKYAVRSSANIEDGKMNSFAGQFDTYLNVLPDNLEEKITECFESLYNENVLDYCKNKNINISDLKMNVIVQEMVDSRLSGVIFTSNPQGILNESVIVVGEGLGENIVSDKVLTTSYFYNNNDKLYYFEGENDYLSKEMVNKLIDISQKIKNILGGNLDIEFGILDDEIYILQARNITTIDDTKPLILDNSNIVESYPNLSLPFTISFVNSVYSGIFESVSRRILKNEKELKKHSDVFKNMVGSANGRLYYKISNWYTIIKFLPFSKKIIPIWQEMLGVKNKKYNKDKVKLNLYTRFMTYINSIYELLNTQKNMKKLNAKFISINKQFYNNIKEEMNEIEILDLYKRIENELLSCWDITLLNDTYTFIFTGLLKARLKKKYSNHEEKANQYISGITNIESLKPIKEMVKLAYNKEILSQEQYEEEFSNYIIKYGDRNLEELKIESLTFRTNPELLAQKIDEYRTDKNKLEKIYKNLMSNSNNIEIKEDLVTKFLIKKCMSGINNREISRLNRSRIYGMVRKMILQIGEIYKEQNIIQEVRDIFYLELDEIKELLEQKNDKKELIETRKKEYEMYKKLPAYSRLIFENKEFNKNHNSINMTKFYKNNKELKGIPCSNGIIKGEALVVNNINEVKNVKDKILITKMTDPGWVFLLATAKGVVSEKGSLLSHTAIISRELKIPSIVGVEALLDTIKTGDIIEIDGTKGTIKILEKKEKNAIY